MSKYSHLLIDGSNLYHRSYHLGKTYPNLATGVINEALKSIDRLSNEFSYITSEIYFLFDNSQSQINIRKQIDPGYKSNREKNQQEDIFRFHHYLIEILKVRDSRYKILLAGSLEADDLVKPLLQTISFNHSSKALMISNDLDWSRNLSNYVHWYDWSQVLEPESFYSKYKFFPSEEGLKIYKAIKGDPSDHIYCAVHNFPLDVLEDICQKAIDFKSFTDFEKYIVNLPLNLQSKIKLHFKDIRRNYMLVDFAPIEKPIDEYIRKSEYNPIHLRMLLSGVGIKIPDTLKDNSELIDSFFSA